MTEGVVNAPRGRETAKALSWESGRSEPCRSRRLSELSASKSEGRRVRSGHTAPVNMSEPRRGNGRERVLAPDRDIPGLIGLLCVQTALRAAGRKSAGTRPSKRSPLSSRFTESGDVREVTPAPAVGSPKNGMRLTKNNESAITPNALAIRINSVAIGSLRRTGTITPAIDQAHDKPPSPPHQTAFQLRRQTAFQDLLVPDSVPKFSSRTQFQDSVPRIAGSKIRFPSSLAAAFPFFAG